MRISRTFLPAALGAGLLLLAGCGGDAEVLGGGSASGSPTDPASVSPSDTPSTVDPDTPSATGKPGPDVVTATGTLATGVEPGCLLLSGTPYLLLPGDVAAGRLAELAEGQQVRVTGQAQEDLMTTCQQGTPLQVTEVEVLDPDE